MLCFFFVKQKTAYEMRISDWSSDVCSSDLAASRFGGGRGSFVVASDYAAAAQECKPGLSAPGVRMAGLRPWGWQRPRPAPRMAPACHLSDLDRQSVV